MSVGYIYPLWHGTQRKLFDAIRPYVTNENKLSEILSDFFRNHVFEVGVTQHVNREVAELASVDLKREVEYKAFRMLAEKLKESGLYTEFHSMEPFRENYEYRILVFGAPKYGVGLGDREKKQL